MGDYSPVRPDEDEDPEVGNFTQIGFSRPEGILFEYSGYHIPWAYVVNTRRCAILNSQYPEPDLDYVYLMHEMRSFGMGFFHKELIH